MKKVTIIIAMAMMLTATACSPKVGNAEPQTPQEVVETVVEDIETPVEIVETPVEVEETTTETELITTAIMGENVFTEENLARGQELAVLVMENLFNYSEDMDPSLNLMALEGHLHSKTASMIIEFVKSNAECESYVTPTMDFKKRYISIATIPAIDDKEKTNSFAYTFTVNRVINGEEQGIENISVLFVIEDGEFKMVATVVKES